MKQKWISDDIPDLSGGTIIVTGDNSGLGFEAVKSFSAKGSETILACRDEHLVFRLLQICHPD